jgi:hypothetical protein
MQIIAELTFVSIFLMRSRICVVEIKVSLKSRKTDGIKRITGNPALKVKISHARRAGWHQPPFEEAIMPKANVALYRTLVRQNANIFLVLIVRK